MVEDGSAAASVASASLRDRNASEEAEEDLIDSKGNMENRSTDDRKLHINDKSETKKIKTGTPSEGARPADAMRTDMNCDCGDEEGDLAIPRGEFDCALCFRMLYDPITTPNCGHTFCRECMSRALQQKSNCPVCRAEVSMDVVSYPVNALLQHVLSSFAKEEYEERRIEATLAKQNPKNKHGIFWADSLLCLPDSQIALHLFEIRYRKLVMRALNTDRRFIVLRPGKSVGVLVKIVKSRSTPDGRFYIEGRGEVRCDVKTVNMEIDAHGLEVGVAVRRTARLEAKDAKVASDALGGLKELVREFEEVVGEHSYRMICGRYGTPPVDDFDSGSGNVSGGSGGDDAALALASGASSLCWWVCSIAIDFSEVNIVFESDEILDRIYLCRGIMKRKIAEARRREWLQKLFAGILCLAFVSYLLKDALENLKWVALMVGIVGAYLLVGFAWYRVIIPLSHDCAWFCAGLCYRDPR